MKITTWNVNGIRSAINKDFYTWLQSLAANASFQDCISLSDRPLGEAYDLELALRFLIFSLIDESELNCIGDVGVFVTEKMRDLALNQNFNRIMWENLFKSTFDLLNSVLSDRSFKRYKVSTQKFTGGFLLSQYEVVAYGVAYNLHNNKAASNIEEIVKNIWKDERYTSWSGSGITATRRLPRLLPFGREAFNGN